MGRLGRAGRRFAAGATLWTLTGCSPLGLLNATVRGSGWTVTRDVAYGGDPRQRLDVYAPEPGVPDAPVVVFLYGGRWREGDRASYRFVGAALAARGIVAVVPDYRLFPSVRYPAFVEDTAAAVAWTAREAARFGGDPCRLFVMGHSAGAYNAAMVALDPRWLAADALRPSILAGWIGLAGPYDFLPIHEDWLASVFDWPHTPPDAEPIAHVAATAPPALILTAGTDDVVDGERNSAHLTAALRDAGAAVEAKRYDRLNHYTLIGAIAPPLRWMAPVLDDVVRFVSRPVPAPTAPLAARP